MAGAYHWEARRRQMRLERRILQMQARGEEQHDQVWGDIKAKCFVLPPYTPAPQNPAPSGVGTDSCPCRTDHVPNHSGKLLKRYSSTEYIQQW